MCECCEKGKQAFWGSRSSCGVVNISACYIKDGRMEIHSMRQTSESIFPLESLEIKINYCPICGRKVVK